MSITVVSYEACALLKYISGISSNPKCHLSFFYTFLLLVFWNLLPLSLTHSEFPSPHPLLLLSSTSMTLSVSVVLICSANPLLGLIFSTPNALSFFCIFILLEFVTFSVILVAQCSWPNQKVDIQQAVWMAKRSVCCTGSEDFFLPFFSVSVIWHTSEKSRKTRLPPAFQCLHLFLN